MICQSPVKQAGWVLLFACFLFSCSKKAICYYPYEEGTRLSKELEDSISTAYSCNQSNSTFREEVTNIKTAPKDSLNQNKNSNSIDLNRSVAISTLQKIKTAIVVKTPTKKQLEDERVINSSALASFIAATGSIFISFIPILGLFAFALIIAALVLGIIGLVQIQRNPKKYSGLGFALFGVIFSSLIILIFIMLLFILIAAFTP